MKILVVDSNSILNRAFYGIKLLTTKDGSYTNGIYGFFNIVLKLIEDNAPDRVIFAFDLKAPTFRHKMYEGYKAQRKGMPPELAQQLPVVKELIGQLGYEIIEREGYEADDILGTIARQGEEAGDQVLLATGDRDSLQLVTDQVTVILATTKAGGAQYIPMTPEAVREKYGVEPRQLIETKALMGDSSDNIPGVPGIGEKTAFSLIQKYGTVERLYEDVDALETTPSVKKKLAAGKEMAELSRKLGEICCEAPVGDFRQDSLRKEPDRDGLYRTLSRLELHTLIRRLDLQPPAEGEAPAPQERTEKKIVAIKEKWPETLPERFVLLTRGENVTSAAIVTEDTIWYQPQLTREQLKQLAEAPGEKLLDDSKPVHKAALAMGSRLTGVTFDIRLAGYLLSPNSTAYTVERLAGEYGAAPLHSDWNGEEMPELVRDGLLAITLIRQLEEAIDQNGQRKLLTEMEIPLAEVLASMELEGFYIDLEGLRAFGEELSGLLAGLEEEIYQLAGHPFNINSPKQLGEVLFDQLGLPTGKKTKSGYSTNAEVLEGLTPYHPIISKILDYRKYMKLRSTYVEGLDKAAGPDSVIRSSFNQTETRTGRISSAEPNMQNIPIRTEPGSRMRKFFAARPGNLLIDADYSQIELRVLAAIAEDKNMIDAFLAGEDIHTNTAAQVFDMPPLFITPLMRSRAKAVNFGIVYGIGAFSLSKDIGVSVAEADQYIKNYLKTFSGVRDYMERTVEEAKEKGYVSTLFGRRRYLPELKSSNHNLRSFGQRVAMNMPIQGTAADIIKIAMVRVYQRLREEGLKAKLILQVHDELIVEAPEEEASRAAEIVRDAMTHAVSLAVPMEVDLKIGKDWAEAH
ncbi:DNA polymerase I [Angelakisella massiliensis]|uniref:DNA polymerase I n=1 Tax=Angelakisella massiliensis TaxID=1871018 RepID=UPI0008F85F9A|nr:DNA polymerase I [Angelakisella massiliensis]